MAGDARCIFMERKVYKEMRLMKGLTQKQLAHVAGVSYGAVQNFEWGLNCHPRTCKKIRDVLLGTEI